MEKIPIIIIALIILVSCSKNSSEIDPNELSNSIVYAETTMREKGIITATSSGTDTDGKDYIKFRIMVDDQISNEEANNLVNEFISKIEEKQRDRNKFINAYYLSFDIKSAKDGEILFNGKREQGRDDIWWQF